MENDPVAFNRDSYPVDKSDWGPGPWQDEPDELSWSLGDVPCRIVRHPRHGQLNGYVGIPPSHPWHGLSYDDIKPYPEVHGGLTFAGDFTDSTYATNTHDARGLWWLGFDCHHAWDLAPGMKAMLASIPDMPDVGMIPDETYKTIEFVRAETENLARQAIDAMRGVRHV